MGKTRKPIIINLPITEVCDSQCIMCNVWNAGKKDEFTVESIQQIFSQNYFQKVRHIGISGGEPTLNKNLVEICATLVETMPELKTLSMTSHGFHTEKHAIILPAIKKICDSYKVHFSLNLSVDGIEMVHIKMRRIPEAFQKVTETAKLAKSLGLHVQLQCTITPINIYNIVKVREFAIQNNYEVIFRIASYIARLSNGSLSERIKLSDKQKSFIADFLEADRTILAANSLGRRLFYSDLASRLKFDAPRKAPCAFQKNALFLSPNNSIYNCSRSEKPLQIEDTTRIKKSINNSKNQKILSKLINETCASCHHDQSGRWPLWKYFTVHNKFYKPFKIAQKLVKIPFILRSSISLISSKPLDIKTSYPKFLVIGCYGGEHIGDAAILGGVILRLKSTYQSTDFDIISFRQDRTLCWVNNLNIPDTTIRVRAKVTNQEIRNYDGLVLAGGPLMNIPTLLANHIHIIKQFKSYDKPFIIEGIGIGPLNSRFSKLQAKKILKAADKITVRTQGDYEKAVIWEKQIKKTQDPAFDYLAFSKSQARPHKSLEDILNTKKQIWVINLRPMWSKYASGDSDINSIEGNLINELSSTLQKLKDNRRFVFMPMNADQFGFSDLEIAYRLESRIKNFDSEIDFQIWEYEPNIDNCNYLLQNATATISMRFHGCIFSLANEIPTIGIDYSTSEKGKVFSLFRDKGIEEQVISVKSFNSDLLMEKVYSLGVL